MIFKIQRKAVIFLLVPLFLLLGLAVGTRAERLPLRLYTSADGLASSAVTNVFKDSRGFLWFATRDGLSRFDGREFTSYRLGEQSGAMTFWALAETRDGSFWISTSDGLFRAQPDQKPEVTAGGADFKAGEPLRLNAEKVGEIVPTVLFEDSQNRLWAGAGDLLLVAENGRLVLRKIELPAGANGNRENANAVSVAETPDRSLWIACVGGVVRRLPDERLIFYPIASLSDYAGSQTVAADAAGRIWVVHSGNLFVFYPESLDELSGLPNFTAREMSLSEQPLGNAGRAALPSKPGEMVRLNRQTTPAVDLESAPISGVFQSSDKKIWVPAIEELFVFEGENYRRLRDRNGSAPWTGRIVEDTNGDLWIGTSGAMKFSLSGLTSYGASDGLVRTNVQRIQQAADGTIYFLHGIDWRVSRLIDGGIESAKLQLPESAKMLWTSNAALVDRKGNWWALAENGLYRFTGAKDLSELNKKDASKVYTIADGLQGNSLYCAFEDSKGNLWFSTRGRAEWSGLTRYDPATGEFRALGAADGFPEAQSPVSFAEDRNGNLWFGFYGGGLGRFDGARFTDFSTAADLPQGSIFGLYVDEKNRLWIGSARDGVARVDDPSAERLEFKKYTTADGLISNNIRTLTGDSYGNIYAGTVRGVSRIAPETGNVRHFTTADGLAADFVTASLRAADGTLWFGTVDGVSRLVPQAESGATAAPPVWISGLTIAGNRYTVSEFGQTEVAGIESSASENNLQIEFVSVGGAIRYQYKLEGAGSDEWSPPASARNVNFANLAPDSYRFLVRAVNEYGQASAVPASVSFRIKPPFYRTWWFLTLAFLTAGAAIFALDRYRVSKTRQIQTAYDELQKSERERRLAESALQRSREERLAELERVRTRIATDLHDDIGSSLTQIAVLSQAAHSRLSAQDEKLDTPLARIATVSVELVEAMSDIVWAINPRKDNLRDLVQRMRRFAADVFTAKGIRFEFDAPEIENKLQLGANIRREVFAIYKECVNNAARHSGGTRAEIALRIAGDTLQLQIADNGRGFDLDAMIHNSQPPSAYGGNGLINIQRRGADLGGRCEIITFPGGGTTVLLEIPLKAEPSPSGLQITD